VIFRRELLNIVKALEASVKEELLPVIRADLKTDGPITDIFSIIANLRSRVGDLMTLGEHIARKLANNVDVMQSKKFSNMMRRAVGIDPAETITPDISDIIEISVANNVSLIKSIPEQYFGKIEALIRQNVEKGRSSGSLLSDIQDLSGVTRSRAKLIARDQTAKLVSNLNQARQESAGIVGYMWHNSGDKAVRGNPSGLYPNSKYNHWRREGKFYLWKPSKKEIIAPDGKPFRQPPPDGHPGNAINCRCTADPVI